MDKIYDGLTFDKYPWEHLATADRLSYRSYDMFMITILVCKFDDEVTSRSVVVRANYTYTGFGAAHNRAAADIIRTGPIAQFLTSLLLLQTQEISLAGTLHQIVHIYPVRINHAVQILSPLRWIRVAVPSYGRDYRLYLKAVRIRQKADGRFVVIRLHICGANIRHNYETGFKVVTFVLHLRAGNQGNYGKNCARKN